MRKTAIVLTMLSATVIHANADPCGLACRQQQTDQARLSGDTRTEIQVLRRALDDAERNGPPIMVALISNQLAGAFEREHRFREAEDAYAVSLKVLDNGRDGSAPELARTLTNLGAVYYEEARFDAAIGTLSRATAIWERLGRDSDADYASALDNLGAALRAKGRYAEAESVLRRALAIREKQQPAAGLDLATVLHNLAVLELDTARFEAAGQHEQRALDLRRRSAAVNSGTVRDSLNLLGLIAEARGDNSAALVFLNEALQLSGDALTQGQTLINLGAAYRQSGDSLKARDAFRTAADLIAGTEARNPLLAAALNNLGLLAHNAGDDKQARDLITRALSIWSESAGTDNPDYASGLANLALTYAHHPAKARELDLAALNIDEAKLGPLHPRVESDLNNLGVAAFAMHDDDAAQGYFEQSLDVHARRHAPENADEGFTTASLAAVYVRGKKLNEAADAYRRAIHMLRNAAPPNDPRVAEVLEAYSHLMRQTGSFAEAENAEVSATGIRVRNAIRNDLLKQ